MVEELGDGGLFGKVLEGVQIQGCEFRELREARAWEAERWSPIIGRFRRRRPQIESDEKN